MAGETLISVIIATRNEQNSIRTMIQSLLDQELTTAQIELLIIDGDSNDETPAIVKKIADADKRVRLLRNPRIKTPFAFNIGLHAANGEYVAILGAHATYAPDYLQTCLNELLAHGATGVSGRIFTPPANDSLSAKLVSWVVNHPFGASGSSYRTQPEGFTDTVGYPLFRKAPLLEIGGYNEQLYRNQDNDLNHRLIERGHKLYVTYQTHADYHAKPTVRALGKYAWISGVWNAVSLRVNPGSLRIRHHIPTIFATAILLGLGLTVLGIAFSNIILLALGAFSLSSLVLHAFVGFVVAIQTAREVRSLAPLLLPPVFFLFHFAYGCGTLFGLLSRKIPD